LDKPTKSLVCSGVLLGSSLEKYIMANKATQTVTAPVQSAVGSAVEMVAGRSLVEAQASLEEIFESTSNGEKMMARGESQVQQADALLLDWLTVWESVDGKQVKDPYCPPRYRGQACHR
jgi:peptide subunit release factor 1 (eRF1)